ncbi:MAG: 30S ribosomal protein S12 methylthiotransferase RimO [Bacteroidales bacterium]|nr:30S ribosomal protein S12 methylthiotransferase RimO [Bacteroidales bacterium]
MKKNKVDIISLGCSKNLVDSENLMRQFLANGYTVNHDSENPNGEIVVINTCGFIGDAKEESVNTILQFVQAKKKRKIGKLLVMGCLSERYLEELKREIPEVDQYYGKFNWKNVITDLGKSYNQDVALERSITTPKHYAYLKISEGCNRTCAYCAIPLMTGKHQSRKMEDIITEVHNLVTIGVKEFQVIAQDLTFYGIDLYKENRLAELIEKISDVPGVERIRLHYAYPASFPLNILPVMRARKNVCNYLDIALQHISNPMLKAMRRNVTKEQTYELLNTIRREVSGIHLRTTLLVGFPGETEQDFEELLEFVRDMKFERMGAFPYSEEEGTYAAEKYEDNVPAEVKQYRMDELMRVQEGIAAELSAQKVGQTLPIIIDREDEDFYIGRSEFDSPEVDPEVLVSKESDLILGEIYNVLITDSQPFELYGKVVEN